MENRNYDSDEILIRQALGNQFPQNADILKGVVNEVKPKRIWKKGLVAVLVAASFLVVTVSAYQLGAFDSFIQRVNPPFADIILPVMHYSEDQGIRITMLGAQRYERTAIVYLSVQDISGENRLTEDTSLFSLGDFDSDLRIYTGDGTSMPVGMGIDHLYFDENSNTKYIQIILDTYSPLPDNLTLITNIVSLERDRCDVSFELNEVTITGEWKVTTNIESATFGINVENLVFDAEGIIFEVESIAINSISINIKGRMNYDPNEMQDVYIVSESTLNTPVPKTLYEYRRFVYNIYMEVAGEIMDIVAGGRGTASGAAGFKEFDNTLNFKVPVDLNEVTAIIINNQRVSIP